MNITVVIPTYNRYEFLKRALKSVYAQSYKVKEIIVIDDGSTDNTPQIVQDFPTITYIHQANGGVSSARNLGIKNASYEWIAFLDSDDEWCDKKIEDQVAFHKQDSNVLISYTDEIWIRDGDNIKIPKKFRKQGIDAFLENISFCNIAPSSVFIHKSIFESVGVFDETLEVCEDYDLWLRIGLKYNIALIDKKLIRKHAGHEDQLSFKHWGMDRFRVVTLEKLLENRDNSPKDKYQEIEKELLKKYTLLLKGAIKYAREDDINIYKEKIAKF